MTQDPGVFSSLQFSVFSRPTASFLGPCGCNSWIFRVESLHRAARAEPKQNSAQNSSRANKQEFLVSTVWHPAVNRDSHCLSDGMWADSKHVGIQTCPLSALSAFHFASHSSNAAKRNDQIKSMVQTKGWQGLGWGLPCCGCDHLYLTGPELALFELRLILTIHLMSTGYHLWSKPVWSQGVWSRLRRCRAALQLCPS